jgi:hypothetical protein
MDEVQDIAIRLMNNEQATNTLTERLARIETKMNIIAAIALVGTTATIGLLIAIIKSIIIR